MRDRCSTILTAAHSRLPLKAQRRTPGGHHGASLPCRYGRHGGGDRSVLRLARKSAAQRDATPLRGDDHPRAHEASADHGDDVIWLRGYECAAVWFGGGSSEPPHGLYGPKTPIAIPTSHRSVTSLALTEIGWRGT